MNFRETLLNLSLERKKTMMREDLDNYCKMVAKNGAPQTGQCRVEFNMGPSTAPLLEVFSSESKTINDQYKILSFFLKLC